MNHELTSLLKSFKNKEVRDLAWAVFDTQHILHGDIANLVPELSPARIKTLKKLDEQPGSLLANCNSNQKLGRYYEKLWSFFFHNDPSYEVLAENLPVRFQQKTLGEFDFIIRDRNKNETLHLEIAIKYYLYYPYKQLFDDEGFYWPGPNSKDKLGKKWQHLNLKQSQLSKKETAIEFLKNNNINVDNIRLNTKAYLFSHDKINPPYMCLPGHTIHPWYYVNDQALYHFRKLYILEKQHWLTPFHNFEKESAITPAEAIDIVNRYGSPRLFSLMSEDSKSVNMAEKERFFIAPLNWPD